MIRFPDPVRLVFRKLARVDDAALDELNSFIATNLESLLSPDEAMAKCATLKLTAQSEAFELLNALVPFIFNRLSSVTDVSSEIADVLRFLGGKEGDEKWTKSDDKRLKNNLTSLLANPKTRLKSKSIRLMTTHQNQFDECEIMSDIRPVFAADGKLAVEAGVICHTLKIGYLESDHKEFFVAMSTKDLKDLKKAIDRSLEKDELLTKVILRAGLEHVALT